MRLGKLLYIGRGLYDNCDRVHVLFPVYTHERVGAHHSRYSIFPLWLPFTRALFSSSSSFFPPFLPFCEQMAIDCHVDKDPKLKSLSYTVILSVNLAISQSRPRPRPHPIPFRSIPSHVAAVPFDPYRARRLNRITDGETFSCPAHSAIDSLAGRAAMSTCLIWLYRGLIWCRDPEHF